MAIGLHSDLKIYHDQVQAGFMQKQAQMLANFLPAMAGAIRIETAQRKGDYHYQAIFDNGPAISRRDLTSSSAQTATALTQDEEISVKINRKYDLVEVTHSSFRNQGLSPDMFFRMLGEDYAEKKFKDWINTGVLACEAALQAAANTHDKSGSTITHGFLNGAFQKLGDHAMDIVSVVMHSNSYHGLVGQAITDKITDVANVAIRDGGTFALGRRFMVSDVPALVDLNGSLTDTYNLLCLVRNAIVIEESEPDIIAIVPEQTGGENVTMRFQAEFAYNVSIKGFKWDVSNGGANPTDATLGTQTNWDLWAGDTKQTAGSRLVVDISTF